MCSPLSSRAGQGEGDGQSLVRAQRELRPVLPGTRKFFHPQRQHHLFGTPSHDQTLTGPPASVVTPSMQLSKGSCKNLSKLCPCTAQNCHGSHATQRESPSPYSCPQDSAWPGPCDLPGLNLQYFLLPSPRHADLLTGFSQTQVRPNLRPLHSLSLLPGTLSSPVPSAPSLPAVGSLVRWPQ